MKLTAERITVRAQQRAILDDASITLQPGELVGLIGPNGAGKSTLLRAIVGSQPYTTGNVYLDDTDITALSARQRARALAYLPQERHVEWPLPSRAVVALGRYPYASGLGPARPADSNAINHAMAAVGATGLANRSAAVLSGGERTRVLLARALAVEAPLLLADEPIAGLDPFHQLDVMEILRATAHGGAGVLAVLHDLSLAMRFMDRVVLMHEGAVIANGTPSEVLTDQNLERVYRVTAARGSADGIGYVLPWSRIS
ncbi:MAG: ABC transporter ATP-binding protein [Gammaproteobacteria bacterium]|nr:ABC transporter ATP-binding protein [Gammaproteobacteria bacterium]